MKSNVKKFMLSAAAATVLIFALAGCGGGGSEQGQPAQEQPAQNLPVQSAPEQDVPGQNPPAAEQSSPLPLSQEADLGISINGKWFPIWNDAAGLIAELGGDYELYSAPSCVFDEGDDKEFAYDGIYIYTNPLDGRDIWYSIYIDSGAYSTARGIRPGSTLDDVYAAYGGRYYWEGDTVLTYSISGVEGDIASPCIIFGIDEGVVTDIEIYYPTNTT